MVKVHPVYARGVLQKQLVEVEAKIAATAVKASPLYKQLQQIESRIQILDKERFRLRALIAKAEGPLYDLRNEQARLTLKIGNTID